ncbi:mannose-6-phosphate isomerase, class I [bacterium]|nr:mannose-6-phosphate isomerase, class I [bacterium]
MRQIHILKNTIQNYAWGSKTAIPEILGVAPSGEPQAELWMGAHPKAPSSVVCDETSIALDEYISSNPTGVLGKTIAEKFNNKLPFLFKILAAEKPLSIQAHPNLAQAREGFKRENDDGIPLDSPVRNYRDKNHKPEIICALTPYWAMNGFRYAEDSINLLEKVAGDKTAGGKVAGGNLVNELDAFKKEPNNRGLKLFFQSLMEMDEERKKNVVDESVILAEKFADDNPAFEWLVRLHGEYLGDVGIFSPLLLNLIQLKPGEAMFLHAGVLHAYLHGVGIELMANSDNVLRGGLTPKHIDLPELFKVVNFRETPLDILKPESANSAESVYSSSADEFVLSVINISADNPYKSERNRSIEIMICTDGDAVIVDSIGESMDIKRGTCLMIPASVDYYSIEGDAVTYKASVPI